MEELDRVLWSLLDGRTDAGLLTESASNFPYISTYPIILGTSQVTRCESRKAAFLYRLRANRQDVIDVWTGVVGTCSDPYTRFK